MEVAPFVIVNDDLNDRQPLESEGAYHRNVTHFLFSVAYSYSQVTSIQGVVNTQNSRMYCVQMVAEIHWSHPSWKDVVFGGVTSQRKLSGDPGRLSATRVTCTLSHMQTSQQLHDSQSDALDLSEANSSCHAFLGWALGGGKPRIGPRHRRGLYLCNGHHQTPVRPHMMCNETCIVVVTCGARACDRGALSRGGEQDCHGSSLS
jgi:hypothetical protein